MPGRRPQPVTLHAATDADAPELHIYGEADLSPNVWNLPRVRKALLQAVPSRRGEPRLWDSVGGYTLTLVGWLPIPVVDQRRKQAEALIRSAGSWVLAALALLVCLAPLSFPMGIVAFVKNRDALRLGRPVSAAQPVVTAGGHNRRRL